MASKEEVKESGGKADEETPTNVADGEGDKEMNEPEAPEEAIEADLEEEHVIIEEEGGEEEPIEADDDDDDEYEVIEEISVASGSWDDPEKCKALLEELEEEFKLRYTDQDEKYMKVKEKAISSPPVIHPWFTRPRQDSRRGWGRGRRDNWSYRRDFPPRRYYDREDMWDRRDYSPKYWDRRGSYEGYGGYGYGGYGYNRSFRRPWY